jgi:hypothetical protein
MQDDVKIPVLTDLIEKGVEIELSELGLDQDPPFSEDAVAAVQGVDPALEQEIRRILDEHMELAWQEIRIAIQQAGVKSSSE